MSNIDLPAMKELLWHKMRADLTEIVPWFAHNDLLLCPTCCRRLKYDDFSVEHIIPKQAVDGDPKDVREATTRNERSGLTLLCSAPIVMKDKMVSNKGCNSWKGKHYDNFLKALLNPNFTPNTATERHHIALFSVGYIGLFREYGYQIALSEAGLLMRKQFFNPNSFLKDIPVSCQMFLMGSSHTTYGTHSEKYYGVPFSVSVQGSTAVVSLRHFALPLPLSRDPAIPFARVLQYVPSRFKFRPDLTSVLG